MQQHERRTSPRIPTQCACKIFDTRSGRYFAARTHDVSDTGALVEVLWTTNLRPDDQIEVFIADNPRRVIDDAEARPARVVRALAIPDMMFLALEFTQPSEMLETIAA